jgi:hypothetical protein
MSGSRQHEGMIILFAVEAGSRAWGFPSPDSDFDVRFVYARPLNNYVTIRRSRDVFERTEGDIDLVGWDSACQQTDSVFRGTIWYQPPAPFAETPVALIVSDPRFVRLQRS